MSSDHRAIPIESSEINSHPQLPINVNQIKWFKTHILFLDFNWCPIEVMSTLPINRTSIGSLGWFALPPQPSLMKCEASYLRRGWVERNSFPSWPKLKIVYLAHRVTHPLSLWGPEHCRVSLSGDQATHSMSMKFLHKVILILDISEIFCPLHQVATSLTIIVGFQS